MDDFEERLAAATAGIGFEYFQLPVAGKESPIYRERCYCYELYHQFRRNWPACAYKLCGEIDKSGHPIIRGNDLDQTKPDFLIHIPEDMEHNFAVIEVKSTLGTAPGVRKDIRTLLSYLDKGGYEHAYYLIYGAVMDGTALQTATKLIRQSPDRRIKLWHHAAANQPASPYQLY